MSTIPVVFYGILSALFANLLTGTAFVLQKKAIDRHKFEELISSDTDEGNKPKKLLKSKLWWTGMILNVIGEIFNLAGYSLSSPAVITPLGALSVVVSAVLSHVWLKEQLSVHGKIACMLCLVGSTLVVLHAPVTKKIYSVQQFLGLAGGTIFIVYFCLILVLITVCLYLIYYTKKPGILSIVTVASISASFSVCLIQAVTQGIYAFLTTDAKFSFVLFIFTGFTIGTLLISLYYFNYALSLFNASQVTPTYYVFFTFYTLLTSSLLWGFDTDAITATTLVLSFLVLACGVFILQKE